MTVINYFVPCLNYIEAISQSNPGVVTTTVPNGYYAGTIVRLNIPIPCGMQQLAGKQVYATIIDQSNFSIGINTTNFDPFSQVGAQPATVIPMGETALTLQNAEINNNNIRPEYGWRN